LARLSLEVLGAGNFRQTSELKCKQRKKKKL